MATTMRADSRRLGATARRAAITTGGGAAFALSLALAIDVIAASGLALLYGDAIHGPRVAVGCMQGTAAVLLLVTVPVLLLSMALVARGVTAALIGWLGALGSIAYQSVLFLFGVPFNGFFFLYVAMLSLAIWSLVALAIRVPAASLAERLAARAPVRVTAAYLLINAALFGLLWLKATVPAILDSASPAFLAGSGMTTGPVQILDFAFTLPLMTLASVLLLRRRPWGYVACGALLVMLAIETASIGVDQWLGSAADPASPFASAAMTPIFAVLTAIGVAMLVVFLRGAARSAGANAR